MLPDAFCSTNSNCSLLVDHDLTVILLYLQILMSVSEGDARRDASTRLGLSPAPVVMASISREMGSLALVS